MCSSKASLKGCRENLLGMQWPVGTWLGSAREVLATRCNGSMEGEVGWWQLPAPGLNFCRKRSHSLHKRSWKWLRWLLEREARAGQSAGCWRRLLTDCWGAGFSFHSLPVRTEPPATGQWTMGRACLETHGEVLKRLCLWQHPQPVPSTQGLRLKQSLLVALCAIALLSFPSKHLNLSRTTVFVAEPNLCHAFWMLGVLCCYYYSHCPLCNANTAADLSAIFQSFFQDPSFPWEYFSLICMGCSGAGH